MATNKQIDTAFRYAGYSFGRPSTGKVPNAIFPADWNRILDLLNDDVVDVILAELGEDPSKNTESQTVGFEYLMAAKILEFISTTGYSIDGRELSLTSSNVAGIDTSFEDSETYVNNLRDRITKLQSQARKLGAQVTPFLQFPGGDGAAPAVNKETVYNQAKNIVQAGTNIDISEDDTANTLTISSTASGSGGLDFDELKGTIVAGDNVSITVDATNELISVTANPQNGRYVYLGTKNFAKGTTNADTITFDTNIPSTATDLRQNIVKFLITDSLTADGQNSDDVEFLVGLLQTSNNSTSIRNIRTGKGNRRIRMWRTTYTNDGSTFIRVNVSRVTGNDEQQFWHGFTAFADTLANESGTTTDGTVNVGIPNNSVGTSELEDAVVDRLLPEPTDSSSDAGKVAALSSDGSRYILTSQSGGSQGGTAGVDTVARNKADAALNSITRLNQQTIDLEVGDASEGWARARNVNRQGGMAVQSGSAFTLTQAAAATYSLSPSSPGGKFLVVRIPEDDFQSSARVQLTSAGPTIFTYTLQVSSMHFLGKDDDWQYLGENLELGDHVASLELQVTGNLAHIGTSVYRGIFQGSFLTNDIPGSAIEDGTITAAKIATGVIPDSDVTTAQQSVFPKAIPTKRNQLPFSQREGISPTVNWFTEWKDLSVGIDDLAAAVAARLLPATLGSKGQQLRVNNAANGIEYFSPGGSGGGFNHLTSIRWRRTEATSVEKTYNVPTTANNDLTSAMTIIYLRNVFDSNGQLPYRDLKWIDISELTSSFLSTSYTNRNIFYFEDGTNNLTIQYRQGGNDRDVIFRRNKAVQLQMFIAQISYNGFSS